MDNPLSITRGKPPAGYLQIKDAGVEKHPVGAVDLQADVAMQHVVEVHHVRYGECDSS
jgi:hypothetical protein